MVYTMMDMSKNQMQQYIDKKKKKQYTAILLLVIMVIVLSVIYIVVMRTVAVPEYKKWVIPFWGGVCILTIGSIALLYKNAKEQYRRLEKERILYACVENLQFDTLIEFEDMMGECYTKEFESEKFSDYLGEEKLYVIYVPTSNKWSLEKKL